MSEPTNEADRGRNNRVKKGAISRRKKESSSRDVDDIALYKRRLLALISTTSPSDNRALAHLLEEFNHFARNYFDFIAQSTVETRRRSLRQAIARLQREAETIARACHQRQVPEFKKHLANADATAATYYHRFKGYKPDITKTPITYFEKLFGIRRTLYSAYPLVSIPLIFANDANEWDGGIAHELGHYIYWNSVAADVYGTIRPRMEAQILAALNISLENYSRFNFDATIAHILINWLEEIFADICGTLLVGPVFAISGQRMADESDANLTEDDDEHPSPCLRPLITIQTIRWLARQPNYAAYHSRLTSIADTLLAKWHTFLRSVAPSSTELRHSETGIPMAEIEKRLLIVVDTILGGEDRLSSPRFWCAADGKTPQALGYLFDCITWLEVLPNNPDTIMTHGNFELLHEEDIKSSQSFEQLLQQLRGKFSSDEEVRQALLLLDLEQELLDSCKSRNTRLPQGSERAKYVVCG